MEHTAVCHQSDYHILVIGSNLVFTPVSNPLTLSGDHFDHGSSLKNMNWLTWYFGLDRGVPPELRNPYPFVRVIFAKKVVISDDFSQNIGQFFTLFGCLVIFAYVSTG